MSRRWYMLTIEKCFIFAMLLLLSLMIYMAMSAPPSCTGHRTCITTGPPIYVKTGEMMPVEQKNCTCDGVAK